MLDEYNQLKDEELVLLAQESDGLAEEILIRKYKALIKTKSHLYFVVGADAEDVMQEGMIGMFKAIHSFREGRLASFRTYAELCINRQMLSAVKQAGRLKYSPLNTSISIYDTGGGDGQNDNSIADILTAGMEDDPETALIMKEKMSVLESAGKDFFSELEGRVLTEFLQGKNYNEIGELMGKTPKSIDNAIQRIRKKLEAHLGRA